MTPIQKRKNKKITKQKVPFVTRKFKNDALEEILNKFYSYDAIGD